MKVLSQAMTEQICGGCFICENPNHEVHLSPRLSAMSTVLGLALGGSVIGTDIYLRHVAGISEGLGNSSQEAYSNMGSLIVMKIEQVVNWLNKPICGIKNNGLDLGMEMMLAFV